MFTVAVPASSGLTTWVSRRNLWRGHEG